MRARSSSARRTWPSCSSTRRATTRSSAGRTTLGTSSGPAGGQRRRGCDHRRRWFAARAGRRHRRQHPDAGALLRHPGPASHVRAPDEPRLAAGAVLPGHGRGRPGPRADGPHGRRPRPGDAGARRAGPRAARPQDPARPVARSARGLDRGPADRLLRGRRLLAGVARPAPRGARGSGDPDRARRDRRAVRRPGSRGRDAVLLLLPHGGRRPLAEEAPQGQPPRSPREDAAADLLGAGVADRTRSRACSARSGNPGSRTASAGRRSCRPRSTGTCWSSAASGAPASSP